MDQADRERFAGALAFALEAHGDQTRKGTRIPYVSHLVQVAGLVLEHGGNADQAIAGLLHDAIEDCEGVDADVLRERFGGEVARIVGVCTDLIEGDRSDARSSWLERKRGFLAEFRATDVAAQLVSGCDKLDNLRSLVADLLEDGPQTLERFNGTPEQIRWYYVEIRAALRSELPIRLRRELDGLIDDLDRLIDVS